MTFVTFDLQFTVFTGGRVRNRFFSRGGGGGNLICLEGVEAKGAGYGGGDYFYLFFCKAGGGEYYCLGARWADGEEGGGKIIMSDFGKRRGEGGEDYHE